MKETFVLKLITIKNKQMGKTLETIKALEEFADEQIEQKKEAQRQLDEIKAQRDELVEALRKAVSWGESASHHILYRDKINWNYLNQSSSILKKYTTAKLK